MIGVFDSGIGGLTVARAIGRRLPGVPLVYLGDTARVPYGNKSDETIRALSLANLEFLLARRVQAVVVACNTSTAVGLSLLARRSPVPVVGVIEPGAGEAVRRSRGGRIGVIGTAATVASGAYRRAIRRLEPSAVVVERACPLFVPLVEEGWHRSPVAAQVARAYLEPLRHFRVDTLILGCTHYPLLKPVIRRLMGPEVELVDSADATAAVVARWWEGRPRRSQRPLKASRAGRRGGWRFFVTDLPQSFERVGKLFLGRPLRPVRLVRM